MNVMNNLDANHDFGARREELVFAESSVPLELREALGRGELIVCVGPELGRSANLPDTSELARELLADLALAEDDLDAATLHEWIDQGKIEEALELLERRMGARFQRVAERVLADGGRPLPALARAIAGLAEQLRAVYATGIDRLIERAFADAWPSYASPRADFVRRNKLIFKLCGTLEFPETWVLTQAAFDREFGERSLRRQLLATALRSHCLLFVGFDPAEGLTQRLFSLIDFSGSEVHLPSHFVVLEHCEPDRRALLERRGLHVIVASAAALLGALGHGDSNRAASSQHAIPKCPYPGLASFDASLAEVFHGRASEISRAAACLGGPEQRHRRWLAIDGSSGVGKTSFVHAGLLPALRRGFAEGLPARCLIASMRPGGRPFRALVLALASALEADAGPSPTPASMAGFVRERTPLGVGLVLVVDQLEELVTLAALDERTWFVGCLAQLLEQQLVYAITTLRSDFNPLIASASPALARLFNDHAERYTLAPISRVGLRAAIAEPAAQLGVEFEAQLVERIASDAEQHFEHPRDESDGVVRTDDAALPLVAHVLRGLWDAHTHEGTSITFAEYKALGGVSGALSRNADALLLTLDRKQHARVKALMLRMTSIEGERLARRTATRVEALALAGGGAEGESLLARLSGAEGGPRLLVVRGEGEDAIVDLVHEALLREWDTLAGWIAANRAQLARDQALAMRAAAWVGQGRPWRSLPRGLERRELSRGRPHGREAERQVDYQHAMRRALWLRGGAWMGFVASLVLGGGWVARELERAGERDAVQQGEVDDLKREAAANSIQEKVKSDLESNRCHEALSLALDGLGDEPGSEALLDSLHKAALCKSVIAKIAAVEGSGAVTALGVDPIRRTIWVGRSDGHLDAWKFEERGHLGQAAPQVEMDRLEGLTEPVRRIRISPAGDRIALSSTGQARLLNAVDGKAIGAIIQGHDVDFSPDGRLAAVVQSKKVILYDSTTGDAEWSTEALPGTIDFAFSPTGDELILASSQQSSSEIARFSMADGLEHGRFEVPSYVRDIAISPDGQRLASASDDNQVRLWNLLWPGQTPTSTKVDVRSKTRHFVTYSPVGALLMLASDSSLELVFPDAGPEDFDDIDTHVTPVFSDDGRWLSLGTDSRVSLRSGGGVELAQVEVANLGVMAFSPTGDFFVTGGDDGTVTRWGVDEDDHWTSSRGQHQGVKSVAFSSANPRRLASGNSAGMVHTWDIGAADLGVEGWRHQGWAAALGFSDDGSKITSFSSQGEIYRGPANSDTAPDRVASDLCTSKHAAASVVGEQFAIACSDPSIRLWDPVRKTRVITTPTGMGMKTTIAVSDRGDRVIVGDSVGALEFLMIAPDGAPQWSRLVGHDSTVTSAAFAQGGDHFVTGDNDGVVLRWSADALEAPFVLRTSGENVEAVAVSSEGMLVAAGEESGGKVVVWGGDGEILLDAAACSRRVTALQFSPDGEFLAVGCSDGSLQAWPVGHDAQIEFACHRLQQVSPVSELPKICRKSKD